jgi:NAD(P)-dependent dehydrogenase (short-subunit alcohol dehydrogenase family)
MLSKFTLKDKTILISGATSGIGEATTLLSAELEGNIFITGRNTEKLNELKDVIGSRCIGTFAADLTNEDEIDSLVSLLPMLDGFVFSVGQMDIQPMKYMRKENFKETFEINYFTAVNLMHALIRKKKLNNGASLVFISSIASAFPWFGGAPYCSSKGALQSFSKVLALELKDKKIRSNSILPGAIKTNIHNELKDILGKKGISYYESKYALGMGEAIDVAHCAVYLLSDAARWITAQKFTIEGGLFLSR